MSYMEDYRFRSNLPISMTPPIGTSNFANQFEGSGLAQSYRSNQLRQHSPIPTRIHRNKLNGGYEPPLLKRHEVELTPDEPITHLAAGRNLVVIATKDKKIACVDTSSSKQTDCDLVRYLGSRLLQAKLHKLFVDPTGRFTLISLVQASDNQPMENLLYVKRLQALPRLKSHIINAVAWNHPKASNTDNNSNSTGTILLGTTKGLVLQAELIHSDEAKFFPLSAGPRSYVKEIFDVGPDAGPITGIEYHQIPSSSQVEKNYVVILSTNNRLYRMVGSVSATIDPPPLHLIMTQNVTSFQDLSGKFNNTKLDVYYPSSSSAPTRYALLTEGSVITGEIHNQLSSCRSAFDEDVSKVPYNTYTNDEELLSTSAFSGMSPPCSSMAAYYHDRPISLVVTNFHVIILYRSSVKAICILNDTTVHDEHFSNEYGNVLGMCKDHIKNIIWIYCERAVFRYKILNETKNVWKIFLDQKKFELAKKYSSKDENNYDRVLCEEAQHYFKLKEYEKSAEIFARSKKPFEDVALMFMDLKKALKKYLLIRFEQFDAIQTTQSTMTLGFLLEIIISSISKLKTLPETEKSKEELKELSAELEQLLEKRQVVECLKKHSKLFYGIMKNYSDFDTYVRTAKLSGDFEDVVQYYMDLGEFSKALEMMDSIKSDKLFYTHGHILMKRMPKEFVDTLIKRPAIDPTRLIPVLIQENFLFNKCSETIRYLEFCVNDLKTDSRVIHNYLFELYARKNEEQKLIDYLETEVSNMEKGQCYLDLQLCLRMCSECKLVRTSVSIYKTMGLYDEALSLALGFDVELAKSIAKKAESEDHQKKLWLAIAENVLTKNLDIQIASDLLKECSLLKIGDILPFFPDYTTIDFFKTAFRHSCQNCKEQIMSIRDGTYDNIASEIRSEIRAFRTRYSIIRYGQRCQICSGLVLSANFYLFPCGHYFHRDCIIEDIMSIDPNYKGIEEKLKQSTVEPSKTMTRVRSQNFIINSISSQNNKTSAVITNNVSQLETKKRALNELDEITSDDCVYCGSILPTYIDKPAPLDSNQLISDDSY